MRWIFLELIIILVLITSCGKKDSNEKMRQRNIKGEFIYRQHKEILFAPPPPRKVERERYPWENKLAGQFPRITKEFFRCKGNTTNAVHVFPQDGKEPIRYFDCGGSARHSLPLENGKEFIYPCLIEILNYIQEKSGKKIVITSGHRCPQHNLYCDSAKSNWGSKHMIGAEVNFYVEKLEEKPQEIFQLIQQYYKEKKVGQKEYEHFVRYEKTDSGTSIQPWYNKEIFVKIYNKGEGRNSDNQHRYPYLSIQVRYDRDLSSKVTYDPKKAQNFLRY